MTFAEEIKYTKMAVRHVIGGTPDQIIEPIIEIYLLVKEKDGNVTLKDIDHLIKKFEDEISSNRTSSLHASTPSAGTKTRNPKG